MGGRYLYRHYLFFLAFLCFLGFYLQYSQQTLEATAITSTLQMEKARLRRAQGAPQPSRLSAVTPCRPDCLASRPLLRSLHSLLPATPPRPTQLQWVPLLGSRLPGTQGVPASWWEKSC